MSFSLSAELVAKPLRISCCARPDTTAPFLIATNPRIILLAYVVDSPKSTFHANPCLLLAICLAS